MAAVLSGCAKNNQSTANRPPDVTPSDAIQNKPMSSDTRYAAGQLAESRGQLDPAVVQYCAALKLAPKHLQALYRLGCVYAQLKRFPESIAIWNRYLKATDESASAYSDLAFTEELAGDPSNAERHYKAGIAKDPANEPCRINYGLMLARHGRIGEAVLQLQAVLSPAEVHFNIAAVYELEHRPEMAKLEYRQALALDPNFSDARAKLATLGDLTSGD